jgi:hypothetical protein
MFNFLSSLMSLLHCIPFRHAIHFLACITLDLISLSSVPPVSKITYILDKIQFPCLCLILNCCVFQQYISILFYSNSCQRHISRKFLFIYPSYIPNLFCHPLKLLNHLQTELCTVLYFLKDFPFRVIYVSILLKLF